MHTNASLVQLFLLNKLFYPSLHLLKQLLVNIRVYYITKSPYNIHIYLYISNTHIVGIMAPIDTLFHAMISTPIYHNMSYDLFDLFNILVIEYNI